MHSPVSRSTPDDLAVSTARLIDQLESIPQLQTEIRQLRADLEHSRASLADANALIASLQDELERWRTGSVALADSRMDHVIRLFEGAE